MTTAGAFAIPNRSKNIWTKIKRT